MIPIYLRFFAAQALAYLFNPYIMAWTLLQAIGGLYASIAVLRHSSKPQQICLLHLPFEGTWKVARGGITRQDSHSWGVPSQRYAYDFVSEQSPHEPCSLDQYPAFGRPILAAKEGLVVSKRDCYRDYSQPGTGWIDWRARDPRGNHVVVRHPDGQFALYAHLQQGSVGVQEGQHVSAGDMLGSCGNSGHSTEPHLHFHVQIGLSAFAGVGVPAAFINLQDKDTSELQVSFLTTDQVVSASDSEALEFRLPPIQEMRGAVIDVFGNTIALALTVVGFCGVALALVRLIRLLINLTAKMS